MIINSYFRNSGLITLKYYMSLYIGIGFTSLRHACIYFGIIITMETMSLIISPESTYQLTISPNAKLCICNEKVNLLEASQRKMMEFV